MPTFKIGQTVETKEPVVEISITPEEFLPVGTHTFQLIVVDDSKNESLPANFRLVVRDTQRPTAVLTGPEAVEFGQAFRLDGSRSSDVAPGKVVSYRWTLLGRE